MQHETIDNLADALGQMWEAHREFLRRLLIGLSRDIDLADDLLQECYIRASAGIESYNGGDSRAWLAAIAKNAFYSHMRLRYVRSEISLGEEDSRVSEQTEDHLDLIEVRRAMLDLPEAQRKAIIMKHYGGYNYEDIAVHMGCPIGTAKSRVSLALRRLREALAVSREIAMVKCADLAERTLMDFIYGRMPDSERKRVEEHLAICSACRERAAEIGSVLKALDAVESEVKGTGIIELHEDGTVTCFIFLTYINCEDASETLSIGGDFETLDYSMVNGEEAVIEPVPGMESKAAKLRLSSPLAAGERAELLMVGRNKLELTEEEKASGVRKLDPPGKLIFDAETPFVMAVRLPPNASLMNAVPEPEEIRSNGATTVIWRKVHEPNVMFEFSVEYRL